MLVLVVMAGVIIWLVWRAYFDKNEVDSGRDGVSSETQKSEGGDKTNNKDDSKTPADSTEKPVEKPVEKPKVEQYEGDDPNKSEVLTGVVTSATVNDGILRIRTSIDQYLSGGRCEMALRKEGGLVYSARANIMPLVTNSTCEGFDVPLAELPSGNIIIWIFLSGGDGKSGQIEGVVSI